MEGFISMYDTTYSFLVEAPSMTLYSDSDYYQVSSAWKGMILKAYITELIDQAASLSAEWNTGFLQVSKKRYV